MPANPVQEAVRKETILSSSSDPETAALLLRDQGETIVLDKLPRAGEFLLWIRYFTLMLNYVMSSTATSATLKVRQ